MKAAISNAVATYAQAAAHRHPRCATPVAGVPAQDVIGQQEAHILELAGELARARARIVDLETAEHDLRGRLTRAEGALQLIALKLGLPEDAPPAEILAAVRGRR